MEKAERSDIPDIDKKKSVLSLFVSHVLYIFLFWLFPIFLVIKTSYWLVRDRIYLFFLLWWVMPWCLLLGTLQFSKRFSFWRMCTCVCLHTFVWHFFGRVKTWYMLLCYRFFFPCFDEFCMGLLAGTLQFSKPFWKNVCGVVGYICLAWD